MINRCYNPKDKDYKWYGEKGIKICDKWNKNPADFEIWAINNGYKDDLTIDRIDENKDYCPENCIWIKNFINSKYKSSTNYLEVDGEVHTGRDWAKIINLGESTINSYLRNYPEDLVKEFIRRRLKDRNFKTIRLPGETWLNAYGL